MNTSQEHTPFPSITRWNRRTVVSEKIDGANVAIGITPEGDIYAQSRKKIITPADDFKGFARWVAENAEELKRTLGFGLHFGEWWGAGIQKRNYDLTEKRFSLFNTGVWTSEFNDAVVAGADPDTVTGSTICTQAPLCHVVPIVAVGVSPWDPAVMASIDKLMANGSYAVSGYKKPEGIVIFHEPSQSVFKVLCENDHIPKSLVTE